MPKASDIPYKSDSDLPMHTFDLHFPSDAPSTPLPLVCFVHGGAWRSEDKADHVKLAESLANRSNAVVAVPNYRLSPKNPSDGPASLHPAHAEDVLAFLDFILTWKVPADIGCTYDPTSIYLIGHSCSAHILASIFLDSSSVTPSLTPSPSLLSAVKAIIVSEGIYDIDILLESFPTYKSYFVDAAFGSGPTYNQFSALTYPPRATHIRWLVIHSKGDTLIDMFQSENMLSHLDRIYGGSAPTMVSKSLDQLTEEHDDLLRGDTYIDIVGNFLSSTA